ncbi:hypothetical protein [Bordetella pertussis]|nr:hypothetical protein [Bordetella pertussis]
MGKLIFWFVVILAVLFIARLAFAAIAAPDSTYQTGQSVSVVLAAH